MKHLVRCYLLSNEHDRSKVHGSMMKLRSDYLTFVFNPRTWMDLFKLEKDPLSFLFCLRI